jgi:hypothetical protein
MKFKKLMIYLIILAFNILNVGPDFEEYEKLEMNSVKLIRKEDLPSEFSDTAYRTISDFIWKTKNLDYEWAIFFDYLTGEILRCVKGGDNMVKINFNEDEFKNRHIASIHNHPEDVYSPPSDKNFGILMRDFEDYELVAGAHELWILKAKGKNPIMYMMLKMSAEVFLVSCQEYCDKLYSDSEKADEVCDKMYGIRLSKFINDKNIKDIQLTKKEYQS